MSATASLAERLTKEFGSAGVSIEGTALARRAVGGKQPEAVVRPRSAEEVASLVRFAAVEKLAIVPVGSGTKLGYGAAPRAYDFAMEMGELRQVAHYDAGDLTVSVDAGLRLRDLQEVLGEKGQFLPLAVPFHEATTIGGTVVSGVDSQLRMKYGRARDFLIGAEFVDGTSGRCKSGGRVVKNVTGYDLHKLVIGSRGALCAVTRLNFRTFPLPEVYGGCVARFASLEEALKYRAVLDESGLPLSTLELLSGKMVALLGDTGEGDGLRFEWGAPRDGWVVYAGYDGSSEVTRRIALELREKGAGVKSAEVELLEGAVNNRAMVALREMQRSATNSQRVGWLARVSAPLALEETISKIEKSCGERGEECAIAVRTGGAIYVAGIRSGAGARVAEGEACGATALLDFVAAYGGHTTMLAGVVAKSGAASKRNSREEELMRQVKLAFDPYNVFSPGVMAGDVSA